MAPTGLWSSSSGVGLSRLEDEKLVAYARTGSSDAIEHLLSRYRRLVESKARSYFVAGAEHDDVVQEGMVGLYKAIRDFRTDRSASFRSFAELCVTRQMVTAVKSAIREKHAIMNDYISFERSRGRNDDRPSMLDSIADSSAVDPEDAVVEQWTLRSLRAYARTSLSELESGVLGDYLDGDSYSEMADTRRRTAKAIDNALQRAKKKIGRRLLELDDCAV